jgi:hypothetical protein
MKTGRWCNHLSAEQLQQANTEHLLLPRNSKHVFCTYLIHELISCLIASRYCRLVNGAALMMAVKLHIITEYQMRLAQFFLCEMMNVTTLLFRRDISDECATAVTSD